MKCNCECDTCYDDCPTGTTINKLEQTVEFKKPVSVIYEGMVVWKSINVAKVYVMRSGKPSYVIDDKGERYDFEYIEDKELIYRTVIRNVMYKGLI